MASRRVQGMRPSDCHVKTSPARWCEPATPSEKTLFNDGACSLPRQTPAGRVDDPPPRSYCRALFAVPKRGTTMPDLAERIVAQAQALSGEGDQARAAFEARGIL